MNAPVLDAYFWVAIHVLLLLLLGWVALHYLVGPLRRLLERGRVEPLLASFLTNSARGAVIAVVLIMVLQQLGIQTASLLTLLGAAVLTIALSVQGTLANFTAGLLVLTFRIVRIGDWIEVGEFRGRVTEMLPFHIVLITADNQRITLPNSLLTGGGVRNQSALAVRRVGWTLPVRGSDDLAAVKEALLARLRADPRILPEPAPQIYVQEWADDKRVLAVQAWTATADYQAAQQELLEGLGMRLEELRRGQHPTADRSS
jgi:small conductance mechanosensitive channel